MIECKKVFLDTTPVIYFLDNNEIYGKKVQRIFESLMESEKSACLTGCDTFLTNDTQLKQFEEINVVLVDELG